jgi:hypothetical protein
MLGSFCTSPTVYHVALGEFTFVAKEIWSPGRPLGRLFPASPPILIG